MSYLKLNGKKKLIDGVCTGIKQSIPLIKMTELSMTFFLFPFRPAKFMSGRLHMNSFMEFCDDGYSGKNFNRPGVKRLIEAARNGSVQCIIVKDLSRFGRDYITVGNYISRVFPFLGVRFISVNDKFDSQRKGDLDSLDTSFRTLIYDLYSRDLSRKVRSAKKNLAERGVYINPVAPYGYVKDP